MSAGGGFLGGLASQISGSQQKKQQGQGQSPFDAPNFDKAKQAAIPAPAASQPGQAQQPLNTQTQQQGFHGLVPMIQNYYQNHQAKMEDAQAQVHMNALQDPSITPEQRQYHISGIQQTYKNRPDVLQKMGIPLPGGQNIPQITPSAQPSTVVPGAGGQ